MKNIVFVQRTNISTATFAANIQKTLDTYT